MGIEVTVATEKGMAIIEETETVIERTATTAVTEKAITAAIVIEVDAVAESGAEETDPRGAKVATAEETAADHAGADHQIHRGNIIMLIPEHFVFFAYALKASFIII